MMYPILCKVRYEMLPKLLSHRDMWKQILVSIVLNWIVAPFLMVRALAVNLEAQLRISRVVLTLLDGVAWSCVGILA